MFILCFIFVHKVMAQPDLFFCKIDRGQFCIDRNHTVKINPRKKIQQFHRYRRCKLRALRKQILIIQQITGMRYYCHLEDLGPINGTVRPEPDNPHDPRAQVVIRSDGKKLGYIPRFALDEYEDFNEYGHVCPFAGLVKVDHNGYMHADILVALPESMDFVKEELTDYLENR